MYINMGRAMAGTASMLASADTTVVGGMKQIDIMQMITYFWETGRARVNGLILNPLGCIETDNGLIVFSRCTEDRPVQIEDGPWIPVLKRMCAEASKARRDEERRQAEDTYRANSQAHAAAKAKVRELTDDWAKRHGGKKESGSRKTMRAKECGTRTKWRNPHPPAGRWGSDDRQCL